MHRMSAQNAKDAGAGRVRSKRTGRPSMNTGEGTILTFSTDRLAEHKRLPMWRERFGREIVRVDIEPMSNESFRAEATLRSWPGLRTVSMVGSPMSFNRTKALAAEGDDSDRHGRQPVRCRDRVAARQSRRHAARRCFSYPHGRAGDFDRNETYRDAVSARVACRASSRRRRCRFAHYSEGKRSSATTYMRYLRQDLREKAPRLSRAIVHHLTDLVALATQSIERNR